MCTAIIYKNILGRTLDYETPLYYNAIHIPKKYPASKDLIKGEILSDYRMMGMIFREHPAIKDGVNEHGLSGITNLFHMIKPQFGSEIMPDKLNISSLYYLNFALGKYKSVQELREDLKNIHISSKDKDGNKVICPDFHFLFADAHGDSIILEPKNSELIAYEDEAGVLTNSPPYPNQLKRYKKLMKDFSPAKDLPGAFDPVSRFIRGTVFRQNKIGKNPLISTLKMLETVQIPEGVIKNDKYDYYTYTRYISLFDTENKKMYLKTEDNPQLSSLSFKDVPEDEIKIIAPPKLNIPSLF